MVEEAKGGWNGTVEHSVWKPVSSTSRTTTPQCPTVVAGTGRPPEPGSASSAGRMTLIRTARSLRLALPIQRSERTSALTGSANWPLPTAMAGDVRHGCEARACRSSDCSSISLVPPAFWRKNNELHDVAPPLV